MMQMYLQKAVSEKAQKKFHLLLPSFRLLMKIAGPRARALGMDPDPYQYATDPQHCQKVRTGTAPHSQTNRPDCLTQGFDCLTERSSTC
jgi:hypothetical protein